jgi:hypothetical protein
MYETASAWQAISDPTALTSCAGEGGAVKSPVKKWRIASKSLSEDVTWGARATPLWLAEAFDRDTDAKIHYGFHRIFITKRLQDCSRTQEIRPPPDRETVALGCVVSVRGCHERRRTIAKDLESDKCSGQGGFGGLNAVDNMMHFDQDSIHPHQLMPNQLQSESIAADDIVSRIDHGETGIQAREAGHFPCGQISGDPNGLQLRECADTDDAAGFSIDRWLAALDAGGACWAGHTIAEVCEDGRGEYGNIAQTCRGHLADSLSLIEGHDTGLDLG